MADDDHRFIMENAHRTKSSKTARSETAMAINEELFRRLSDRQTKSRRARSTVPSMLDVQRLALEQRLENQRLLAGLRSSPDPSPNHALIAEQRTTLNALRAANLKAAFQSRKRLMQIVKPPSRYNRDP